MAEFSNAINSVGEQFVDALLRVERKGKWWLDDEGQWRECVVSRLGPRSPKTFARGNSPEWAWFPQTASRLADPMTGPDHVVVVTVPSLRLSTKVALEQKLRFGSRQDAFADSATYLKHLLARLKYRRPNRKDFNIDSYCNGLLDATKAMLCNTKKDGTLSHSGSVPQVCLASVLTLPNKIFVFDKATTTTIGCDCVGFLPPAVNTAALSNDCPARAIIQRAKVRLWLGLDSLLQQCSEQEVGTAWCEAIGKLTEAIHEPKWQAATK